MQNAHIPRTERTHAATTIVLVILTPQRRAAPPGGRFLTAAFVCLFALVLVCLVFVWTPVGQGFDTALLPMSERGASYEQESGLLQPAKDFLALLGTPLAFGAPLLAAVLVSRRLWPSLAAVGVVLGSVLAARTLKEVVERPDLDVIGSSTHNSFPSGHVAGATALLLAFALVLPARTRWWVLVPGAVVVAWTGVATMVAGWHRLSDVVGGALVAGVLYCLAAAALADEPAPGDS